jgi:hypothetical protein
MSVDITEARRTEVRGNVRKPTHRTGVTVINRECEPGQQWDDNAAFPRFLVVMGPNNSLNNCVSDAIFDLDVVHGGSGGGKMSDTRGRRSLRRVHTKL